MHSAPPSLTSRLRISIAAQQYEGGKEQPPFTGLKQFLAVSLRESLETLVTCGARVVVARDEREGGAREREEASQLADCGLSGQ